MKFEDSIIISEIRKGNRDVFKAVYGEYYEPLVQFATGYLRDPSASQDVVQNFFLKLWSGRKSLVITNSLHAYCYRSVRNACLNKIRDLNIRDERNLIYLETMLQLNILIDQDDQALVSELNQAIEDLPGKMREVFLKKYFEGKRSREIADELSISENTVNTHLKRGKEKLRSLLSKAFKSWIL